MRIETGIPSSFLVSLVTRDCIMTAAPIASSTVSKVDITSSPIVLITVPLNCRVASFMISRQSATVALALVSPNRSYIWVLPTTSANTIATSRSFAITRLTAYLPKRLIILLFLGDDVRDPHKISLAFFVWREFSVALAVFILTFPVHGCLAETCLQQQLPDLGG